MLGAGRVSGELVNRAVVGDHVAGTAPVVLLAGQVDIKGNADGRSLGLCRLLRNAPACRMQADREGGALHGVMSVAMWICALGRRRTMWSGVLVFTCVIVRQLRSSRGFHQKS